MKNILWFSFLIIVARQSNNEIIITATDNGDNWTAINTGLTDLTIFDLELNDNFIIAATNTQGVFRFPLSSLNLSTGIQNIDTKSVISIFPNPTNDFLS